MSTVASPITSAGSNADQSTGVVDPEIVVPAITTDGEPTDTTSADPEAGEPTLEPGTVDTDGQPVTPSKEDGRVIPQWMKALQESNPEAYKKAKADLFEMRDRRTVHPTIQAAREEHDLVESLGGREGANQLREDAGFFKDAATQFLKGDPNFVKDLWEEDTIAASLHVQPMLEEFRTRDVEGYKSTIARIWANDFKGVGFAPALQNLVAAINSGNKDGAAAIAKSIQEWHDSIVGVANKAEDPRVKSLLAERAKQHDTRQQTEHQEFLKSYRTDTVNSVIDDGTKVFDSFFKGRKIDAEDRTDLLREVLAIANRAVESDKDFITQRNKHLESGDAHSAKRLTKARYSREFTDAAKRVARRYGLVSGKAPATTQQKTNQQTPGGPKAAPGYSVVSFRPTQDQIDYARTNRDMIMSRKAILKDGRKVDWSAFAAKAATA